MKLLFSSKAKKLNRKSIFFRIVSVIFGLLALALSFVSLFAFCGFLGEPTVEMTVSQQILTMLAFLGSFLVLAFFSCIFWAATCYSSAKSMVYSQEAKNENKKTIKNIKKRSYEEGFNAGHKEGYKEGISTYITLIDLDSQASSKTKNDSIFTYR